MRKKVAWSIGVVLLVMASLSIFVAVSAEPSESEEARQSLQAQFDDIDRQGGSSLILKIALKLAVCEELGNLSCENRIDCLEVKMQRRDYLDNRY